MTENHELRQIIERLVEVVGTLAEDVEAATTALNSAVTFIEGLQAQITSLEAQVAAAGSGVSATDQTALEAATTAANAATAPPVTVPAALTFTPGPAVTTALNTAASFSLGAASGGTGPYTFTVASLPDGLAVDTEGNVTGTPTTGGTFSLDVTVTDSSVPPQTATGTVAVTIQ